MKRNIHLVSVLVVFLMAALPLFADYQGLSVATNYPSLNVSSSDMITFDLRIKSYGLAPQRVNLSLTGLPEGWEYQFVGGGGLVNAVFTEPDSTSTVQLWVIPSDGNQEAVYSFWLFLTNSDFMPFVLLPISIQAG